MTNACLRCSTENPPDHSYCRQCGSRLGVDAGVAAPGSSPALVRRPPDESRLPPAGSFRSGLYRLIRALFVNQKPVTSQHLKIERVAGNRSATGDGALPVRQRNVTVVDESERSEEATAGFSSAAVASEKEARAGPASIDLNTHEGDAAIWEIESPQSRGALSRTAMYWLARALLLRHLLPGRESQLKHPAGESDAHSPRERGAPARLPPGFSRHRICRFSTTIGNSRFSERGGLWRDRCSASAYNRPASVSGRFRTGVSARTCRTYD